MNVLRATLTRNLTVAGALLGAVIAAALILGLPGQSHALEKALVSNTVTAMTALDPPANLMASPDDGRVVLGWSLANNPTITKYQYSIDGGMNFNDISGSAANLTGYTITGLTNGTEYTFALRAVQGSLPGASATVTATPAVIVPAAPVNLRAEQDDGWVSIRWDNPYNLSIIDYQERRGERKLNASDGANDDYFGYSVDIDGDTAVVGAYEDYASNLNRSGSAHVFTMGPSGRWSQQAKLIASDPGTGDQFGISVAVDGDTVLVGAQGDNENGVDSGSAYVFTRVSGVWGQTVKLTPSDGAAYDWFGQSVALDGDTAVIGAYHDNPDGVSPTEPGSVYIFTRDSSDAWSQAAKLTASDGADGDQFGWSVAIDADTIMVGSPKVDVGKYEQAGAAYLFAKPNTGWDDANETAKLTASDSGIGDNLGHSVAVDGNVAIAGAPMDDAGGTNAGASYVSARNASGMWGQFDKLTPSNDRAGDFFGASVAVDGDAAVVGAYAGDDNGSSSGLIYVFTKDSNGWSQTNKYIAVDNAAGDYFGRAVAVDGTTALVGAPQDDDKGSNSGSAYILDIEADWTNIPGGGGKTTAYAVRELTNGIEYAFAIRAVNVSGIGPAATVTARPLRPAPTNLVAEEDSTRVVLQWDWGDPAITHYLISSYIIDGSGNPPPDMLVPAETGAKTTVESTSLTNGTEYTFTVQAAEVSGGQTLVTGVAASVNATPAVNVPATPANLTAAPGHGQVRVTWDNPNNITIRKYQYSTDGGDTFNHMNGSGRNTTSFTFTGLTNGTEYQLAIRASNRSGESEAAVMAAIPADPTTVLVSNLGKSDGGKTSAQRRYHAQAFTTGGDTQGYRLAAIEVDLQSLPGNSTLTVQIWDDGSGNPGDSIFTLSNPASVETGIVRFTAPADTRLEPNTKYWVHLGYGGSTRPRWGKTNADGEDPGAYSGWSIANDRRYRTSSSGTWQASGSSLKVRVNTHTADGSVLVSNLGKADGGNTSANRSYHAQAFTTGGNTQGYPLASIEVDLQTNPAGASIVTAQVWDDDGSGNPGNSIFTMSNPDSVRVGIVRFTAPADTHLDANTKYWLHLDYDGEILRPRWGKTNADGEEPAAYSGWSIGNDRRYRTSSSGTWETSGSSLKVRVKTWPTDGSALVSNLGQAYSPVFGSTSSLFINDAQAFTTGGDTRGYPLTAIETDLQWLSEYSIVTAEVWDDDGSGNPGSSLFTLTNPSELKRGILRFNAPAGTRLEANTQYWVYLAEGSNTGVRWGQTDAYGEDPGVYPGWSIADDRVSRVISSGAWHLYDSSIKIRVDTNPAPVYVSNYWQTEAPSTSQVGTVSHAQRFTTSADAVGFYLGSIDLEVTRAPGSGTLNVTVRKENNASGTPGDIVYRLTNPASIGTGIHNFQAPDGAWLGANTNYFVRLAYGGGGTEPRFRLTADDDEDSGAYSGWSIADGSHSLSSGTWSSNVNSVKISIKGPNLTPPPPGAPANLTATPGDGRVTVTWDNPGNISIRKYQYSTDGGASFSHMNRSNKDTTSFTFKNLTNGTEYQLAIRASNLSGESAPATVTATPSD